MIIHIHTDTLTYACIEAPMPSLSAAVGEYIDYTKSSINPNYTYTFVFEDGATSAEFRGELPRRTSFGVRTM